MTSSAGQSGIPLAGLCRAEFAWEKWLTQRSRWLDVAAALAILVSAFLTDNLAVVLITLFAAVSLVLARVLSQYARERHDTAEQARRSLVLLEGLGQRPGPLEEAELRASFSRWAVNHAPEVEVAGYHTVKGQAGPSRLRYVIQEDAFFTAQLCGTAAKRVALPGLVSLSALVALLVVAASSGSADVASWVARGVAVVLTLAVSLQRLSDAVRYRNASAKAAAIDRALEKLGPQPALEELLPHLGNYDVVAASIPAIPEEVYRRERDRIESIWQSRIKQYQLGVLPAE